MARVSRCRNISLSCTRNAETQTPSVEIKIYAFTRSNNPEGQPNQRLRHCLIDLELVSIQEMELSEFNHQNVVFSIVFEKEDDLLTMQIDPSYGLEAYITARQIRVKHLEEIAHEPLN